MENLILLIAYLFVELVLVVQALRLFHILLVQVFNFTCVVLGLIFATLTRLYVGFLDSVVRSASISRAFDLSQIRLVVSVFGSSETYVD